MTNSQWSSPAEKIHMTVPWVNSMKNMAVFIRLARPHQYLKNGFIFLPSRSGMSYIYVNNHEVESLKNDLPKSTKKYEKDVFIIKRTLMREVFDVIDIESEKRFGICYITDIKKSHEMRQLFKDKIYHRMKCIYNDKFKKYEPIEVIN